MKDNASNAKLKLSRKEFLYLLGGAALSVGALGVAGCNSASNTSASNSAAKTASAKKTTVKLKSSLPTLGCVEPTMLAERLGYYKEEGIEVEFVKIPSSAALVSNDIQFLELGTNGFITFVSKGVPVKWVAGLHQGGHAVIAHKDSGINKFEDLLGKRIAVYTTQTGPTDIALILTLKEKGYDFNKDVQLVGMDSAVIPMAVRQRTVDAGCICPHGGQMAVYQGWGKAVLADWEGTLFPGKRFQCGGLVMMNKFMKEQPEAAAGVKRAFLKTLDYMSKNPKEVAKMMAEDLKNKDLVPVMELMLKEAKYTPMTNMKTVNAFAEHMYKQGLIKKLPDMTKEIPQEYQEA